MIFRQLFDPETSTYTYLLADSQTGEGALIDPVKEQTERDINLLNELGIKLMYVLETHVHADHVTAANNIRQKTGAQIVYGNLAQITCADCNIQDGDKLQFGGLSIQALSTPGHTNGCTSYYIQNMVFTGDALLIRSCGRTDFQQGSAEALYESIHNKLFTLPDNTLIYPGHDYQGLSVSTIGEEKKYNPRLGGNKSKEDFITIMANLKLARPKKIDKAVPANMECGC